MVCHEKASMKLLIFLAHCIASQVPERENFGKQRCRRENNWVIEFLHYFTKINFLEPNAFNNLFYAMLDPLNSITLTNYPFKKIPAMNVAKHWGKTWVLEFLPIFTKIVCCSNSKTHVAIKQQFHQQKSSWMPFLHYNTPAFNQIRIMSVDLS